MQRKYFSFSPGGAQLAWIAPVPSGAFDRGE
jgi:hypothetical protein